MKSRAEDLKEFLNSQIWADIVGFVGDILQDAKSSLETVDDWDTLLRLQGEIAAYRRMMAVVDVMIHEQELLNQSKTKHKKGARHGVEG